MGIRYYYLQSFTCLAEDEDVGDFTDVINGWDMVVEMRQGNPYPETTVRIKPKQTPLSDNNSVTIFETSSTMSVSLMPPIPTAPGSSPPCPGSITTKNLFCFTFGNWK